MLTSVVIPCWNAVDLTRVCVRQVLRWTAEPFELILIDNGSTDGTAACLRGLKARNVRVITNRKNLGYPKAMNQGLAAARGEALVFGNSDAAVTPGWLEAMLGSLAARPKAGGVSPCANPWRLEGAPIGWAVEPWYRGVRGMESFARVLALRGERPAYIPARGFVPGFWFMARRAALDEVGGFDERFTPGGNEDLDLQWRMMSAGWEVGFAGRAYVHHIGFASVERNGFDRAKLYDERRQALLYDRHPGAVGLPLEARTPFDPI